MSKKLSSDEVLARIGAQDFRSINRTQLIEFVSAIPEMDKETAIKCIEQFPNFTEYANGMVKELYSLLGHAVDENKNIQKEAIVAHKNAIDELSWLLHRENVTEELQTFIINQICEETSKIDDLAKEHQHFIKRLTEVAASVATLAVGAAATYIGVKFFGKKG